MLAVPAAVPARYVAAPATCPAAETYHQTSLSNGEFYNELHEAE